MKLKFTKIFNHLGLIVIFAKDKSKKERASKYENNEYINWQIFSIELSSKNVTIVFLCNLRSITKLPEHSVLLC